MYDPYYDEYYPQTPWMDSNYNPPRTVVDPAPAVDNTPRADDTLDRGHIIPAPGGSTGGGTNTGGGMTEAEGRAYDAAHGLIGGYMTPNGWVSGSPRSGGGGGGSDYYGPGGYGNYVAGGSWNTGDAPQFSAPRFQAPPPFVYGGKRPDAFVAPTEADMLKEPGYQFRLDQGRKALEASAAGRGVLRTGGTLKDLIGYGQQFASGEYANIYNRRASEHDRGFREYLSDYDMASDTYARNYNVNRDVYDREFQALKAEYEPKYGQWQTNANIAARRAEMEQNNMWAQERWEQEMAYKRERDRIEDAKAASNMDD